MVFHSIHRRIWKGKNILKAKFGTPSEVTIELIQCVMTLPAITQPSKHFSIVSTLSFGWYNVMTWDNVKPMLKQRCVFHRWNLQRRATSNQPFVFQRWYKQRWSTTKQSCCFQRRVSQCWLTSKQRCENDHF